LNADKTFRAERASPALRHRELAGLALAACAASLAMNWPVVRRLGSSIPGDPHDPLLQSWEIAWGGHALLHQPLHYFQANIFWPLRDALAFSDALAGYAPVAVLGHGPEAALVRYNVLFLLAYALAFAGAYLLARELGARPAAAAVAGAAFGFSPWRLAHVPHLNVLSSGGVALSIFLLARGYRRRAPGTALAGWLVAAWQVSLGWNLGLSFAYVLGVFALISGAAWLWGGRKPLGRPVVAATFGGIAVLLAVGAVMALPYFRVLHDHPEARRTIDVVAYFSPPPRGFLAAPEGNLVWGSATRAVRGDLSAPDEQTLFPGALVLVAALVGLAAPVYPGRLRLGLALAAVVSAVFSLGYGIRGASLTYGVLYEHFPGWQGLRTPGRITTFTTLALALLAAAGAQYVVEAVERRSARPTVVRSSVVSALLVVVVLLEGYGRIAMTRVPSPPVRQAKAPAPQLHLPIGLEEEDVAFMHWSIDGFPTIVNGSSGFTPRSYRTLAYELRGFPDAATVARLQALGVRIVVLHRDQTQGTPWAKAAGRPVGKLPVSRQVKGPLVLYRILQSPSAAG